MKEFAYYKPATVEEAVQLLAQPEAKLLAGGMTLLPTMKQHLAAPKSLIDLSKVDNLRGIRLHDKKGVIIGAMTTHAEVAASRIVAEHLPALAHLAGDIGDVQVRRRGTLGGSLANNDPAADYPAALLGLGGSVHTDRRTIEAEEYFDGLFATTLEENEVIRHVHFPVPRRAAYLKFPQPASLYALVGVFVAATANGARVAVTGAGDGGVFRAAEMEAQLDKDFSAAALDGVTVSANNLLDDVHGDAEYRASLIVTLAKRAVAAC